MRSQQNSFIYRIAAMVMIAVILVNIFDFSFYEYQSAATGEAAVASVTPIGESDDENLDSSLYLSSNKTRKVKSSFDKVFYQIDTFSNTPCSWMIGTTTTHSPLIERVLMKIFCIYRL